MKIRSLRLGALAAAVTAVVAMTGPAHATPIYPMLFVTINAPVAGVVTYSIDAQAPAGWTCVQLTWAAGSYHLQCSPPAAPRGFENTCVWNVVKVQTSGVRGALYGQSHCDKDPGASANVAANAGLPAGNAAWANPNLQFSSAYCRADTGINDTFVRPWTVRCSVNH